jgi:hypothetical protein
MMVLDFLDGSRGGTVGRAGLTSVGGSGGGNGGAGIDAVLRVSGSTGGTIGADFLAAGGSVGAGDKIAGVLLGISGSAVVGDVMGVDMTGGTVIEVVRRGSATDGGRDVGVKAPPGAIGGVTTEVAAEANGTGGGVVGTGGGRSVGAMMGADLATGNGILDGPPDATSRGGAALIGGGTAVGIVTGVAVAWRGSAGGVGGAGTSGGCGAIGSGTRVVFISAGDTGSGGIVVRAVSARPDELFFGMPTVSFVIAGSEPVMGSAGGRLW